MWVYEKRLQYPVNITQTNAKLAQVIISQFGGPDGELAASQRYLSQRYTMPDGMTKRLLNDIGTEEYSRQLFRLNVNIAYNTVPSGDKPEGLFYALTTYLLT